MTVPRALIFLFLLAPVMLVGCGGGGGGGSSTGSTSSSGGGTAPTSPTASTTRIDSVVVDEGPTTGGTRFRLLGAGFKPGSRVTVGGAEATDVVVSTDGTQLEATAPPSSSVKIADIVVMPPGAAPVQAPVPFTYNPPPAITTVSPIRGPTTGGTQLTLIGTNFGGQCSATVGGAAATSVIASPDGTQLVLTTPPRAAAGFADISVTSPTNGVVTAANAFTYFAVTPAFPPSVKSVVPDSGPLSGGTQLQVQGQNFRGLVRVTVGGAACTNVFLNASGTLLVCNTPAAQSAGARDLVVTNQDGTTATLASGFRYNDALAISTISPGSGPTTGGTLLTIDGVGFLGNLTVRVGAQPCANVTVNGPRTRITCVTPGVGQGASVSVEVLSDLNGSASRANGFTYVDPPLSISSISPNNGPMAGGTTLTIDGQNLLPPLTVLIGSTAAGNVNVDQFRRRITCTAPPSGTSGARDVTVSSPVNGQSTILSGYTYNPLPTISTVTPSSGPTAGGTLVAVDGGSYVGSVSATIGGAPVGALTVNSTSSRITFTAPASPSGTGAKTLAITASGSGAVNGTFTYNPLPGISSVSPASGPLEGSTPVTITGSGFLGTVNVTIGGRPAPVVTATDTQINVLTPAASTTGSTSVEVSASLAGAVSVGGLFTYDPNPVPVIGSVTPSSGPVDGTNAVTITGANFKGNLDVTIDGRPLGSLAVDTQGTQIQGTVPASLTGAGAKPLAIVSSTHGTAVPSTYTYNPTPSIGGLSPADGPQTGGNPISITGSNFFGSVRVRIGDFDATDVSVVSPTQITCRSPGAVAEGDADIEVVSSTHGAFTLPNGYHFNALPTIASVMPGSGPLVGGSNVTVSGTGFLGTVNVSVDGVACTSVVPSGPGDQVSFRTPPSASGTGAKTLRIESSSHGPVTGVFTYNAPPTITGLAPVSGPAQGGTTVTVTGTGFLGTVNVTFGSTPADNVLVENTEGTQLVCETRPSAAGTVTVFVGSDLTGTVSRTSAFTFNPTPTITSVLPALGPVAGGTPLVIQGADFEGDISVRIGAIETQNVTVDAAKTRIDCVTDAGPAGTFDVIVLSSSHGEAVRPSAFTYFPPQPIITSVVPGSGPLGTTIPVTITGASFLGTVNVSLDGVPATGVSANATGTSLTCLAPSRLSAGAVPVDLSSSTNGAVTLPGGFRYNAAPVISSVAPPEGPLTGGNTISLYGSSFLGTVSVTIDGVACTNVSANVTGDRVTCTVPAGASLGAKNVELIASAAGATSSAGGYSYRAVAVVSGAVPADGPLAGGTAIAVFGTNLTGTSNVTLDGVTCQNVVVTSATTVTCLTPVGLNGPGAKTIQVASPIHGQASLPSAFTYNALPTIAGVTPTSGPLTGTGTVTISGAGYLGTVSATIDGAALGSLAVDPAGTRVTGTIPANATFGPKVVAVTASRTGSVTLTSGYTYNPAPVISGIAPNEGGQDGGNTILISGSFFGGNVQVTIGGNPATITSINGGRTQITCIVPSSVTTGAKTVTVVSDTNGTASVAGGYTYNQVPSITSVTPSSGPANGGTTITIVGQRFFGSVQVRVGPDLCSAAAVTAGTTITAVTPSPSIGPGLRDVTVISSTNGSATLPNAFRYNTPPVAFPPVSPTNGPQAGGTLITIDGQRFTGNVTVTIDNAPATNVFVQPTEDQIICRTPAATTGVGFKNITIQSSVNGVVTMPFAYRYNELPRVISIVPNEGPVGEFTPITITGEFFGMNVDVSVAGQLCTNVSVTADLRTLTCIVPPSLTGPGAKTVVIDSERNGILTIPGGFTYHPLPTITTITPDNGPLVGGNRIDIDGTGYRGTVVVKIDGNACTGQTINSTFTRISCDVPAATSGVGAKDVYIRSSATGGVTATGGYTYNPTPTITSITPDQGPVGGGNTVTISGNGYGGTVNVTFGANASQSVTGSVTTINVLVPASTTGANPVDVIIASTRFGTSTFTGAYTYRNTPTFGTINPDNGPQDGGQQITITGTNLFGAAVTIGGASCTNVTNTAGGNQLTALTPPRGSAGTVDVVVTAAGGTFTITNGYTYNPKPTITLVSPDNGPLAGNISINIDGTNFGAPATMNVTIGGNAAAVTSSGPTRTTVTLPASTSGTGAKDVVVKSATFGSVTATNGFTYNPTPTITSLVPADGPIGGGNIIAINGTEFKGTVTVTIDGANAPVLGVNPGFTQATVVVPQGSSTGTKTVVLTATLSGTATATNAFTYNPGPIITSIVPDEGPVGGGTTINITGSNFLGAASVFIAGVATTNVTVNQSATVITCVSPASQSGAGTRDLTVNCTLSGSVTSTAAGGGGFTYNAAPTIQSINPASGPLGGTNRITITGTDFDGIITVSIDGQPATNITVNASRTVIGLDVPASTTGPGSKNVSVTATLAGTANVPGGYVYNTAPDLLSVVPAEGPNQGGATVVIIGNDFNGGLNVAFAGRQATIVSVSPDSSRITVTTPSYPGTGPVTVTVGSTTNGTVTAANAYVYNAPPTVSSLAPDSGPLAGGTTMTIGGTLFRGVVTVAVDGNPCTNVQVTGTTTITCVTPVATSGVGEKTVRIDSTTNGFVNLDPPDGFRYNPLPIVSSINPDNGPAAGGSSVTIGGQNFGPTINVTIDGAAATNISVTGTTTITLLTPSARTGIGTKDVIISSTENGVLTVTNGYTYNATPTTSGPINPNNGPMAGNTPITISGTGFVAPVTVNVGGAQATNVQVTGTTTVTALTPARATPGTVAVTVTSAFTGDTLIPAGYTYNTTPTVTTISPSSGPQTGNQVVTIDGANFSGNVTVTFGGNPLTGVAVTNGNTRITGVTPASGTAGPVTVSVESSTHGITNVVNGYTYNAAPQITTIVPDNGPVNASTAIVINGSGFADNLTVTIGGQAALNPTRNASGTQITATAQALSPAGAYDVVVTSTLAGVATKTRGFTYTPNFTNNATQPTGAAPTGVALGDVNGDGRLDFVTSNQNDDSVTVMVSAVTPGNFAIAAAAAFPVTDPGSGYIADEPSGVAVADFNLDGKLDIATSNRLTSNVSILRNVMTLPTNNPTFSQPVGVFFAGPSSAIATADFNGDGKADIILTDETNGRVYVGMNTTAPGVFGNPTFNAQTVATGLSAPTGVAVADFDGDGDTDFVVTQRDANVVTVWQNATTPGSSTMNTASFTNVTTGLRPRNVAVGDLNGDGVPDLVVANVNADSITPILNTTVVGGAFTLLAFAEVPMDTGTAAVAIGDFDGSGQPDIVTANDAANTVSVRLNQTALGSMAAVTLAGRNDRGVGQTPSSIVVADVDADGRQDIVVGNRTSNSVSVLFNSTGQGFTPASFATAVSQAVGTAPTAIARGDFNGDGRQDLIIAQSGGFRALANGTTVGVTTGFTFNAQDSSAVSGPSAIAVGHLNGDGRPDLVVTGTGLSYVHVFLNTTTPGSNTLTFSSVQTYVAGTTPQAVVIADFDGDGRQDFAVANSGDNQVAVFRANPANDLASTAAWTAISAPVFNVGAVPRGIVAADVNGDGWVDLAVANRGSSTVSILANNANGTIGFTAAPAVATGLNPQSVKLVDVNGDGRKDVVSANNGASSISTALNTSNAGQAPTFGGAVNTTSPTGPTGIDHGEMNGDGRPDVATSNNGSTNASVYLNTGAGFPVGSRRDFGAAANPFGVVVVDLNNDYHPDVAVVNNGANTVSLLRNQTVP